MLGKFLNKKVEILVTEYCANKIEKGIVTKVDSNFIELDNNKVIQIKYIISIKSI